VGVARVPPRRAADRLGRRAARRRPNPAQPADPNELTWFYPGEWFGRDEPVPTVQLKWLRRAQQDYEYLWLARERGEVINTLLMARLITKPVEIQPGQVPDPAYALMCGTTTRPRGPRRSGCSRRTILLRRAGQPVDAARQEALYCDTLRWVKPAGAPAAHGAHHPVVLGHLRGNNGLPPQPAARVDIYNASDNRPDRNLLRWAAVPPAGRRGRSR
jgi:hypothetical protein